MENDSKAIVIVAHRPWNIGYFRSWQCPDKFTKHLIAKPDDLRHDLLARLSPQYIFFLDWSWKIPAEIYENFECVLFHMTDLPFGRGGSPLQNLIIRGIYDTKISAIRVVNELDAGPVYTKHPLNIKQGSAQQIFERMGKVLFFMIDDIVANSTTPRPQTGKVVTFKRRTPAQSKIPKNVSGRELYDFIRMLDAHGYPKAFTVWGDNKYELSNARLVDEQTVRASVRIVNKKS